MASKVYRMTEARRRAIEQYTKQYKRISRYVTSLTKKGYKVPEGIVPAKPSSKAVKQLSTTELKKQTKEAEYLKSYRILHKSSIEIKTDKTTELISAEEYQDILRKKRRSEREADEKTNQDRRESRKSEEEQFREQQRKRDEEARKRAKADAEYKHRFSKAQKAFDTVQQMIDDLSNVSFRGHKHVKAIWNEEIHNYGLEKVMASIMNMEDNDELIDAANIAIMYGPGSTQHQEAIASLITIIRGHIPSAQEMKELEEEIEAEAYTDDFWD